MPELVGEATKLWDIVPKLLEARAKNGTHVATMDGLRKAVLWLERAVTDLLPAVEKTCDLRDNTEKNERSTEIEFSLIMHI